jgi:hypothetical protein
LEEKFKFLENIVDEVRNKLGLVISYKSKFKDNWEFYIMIIACWNVFWLPIGIAFPVQVDSIDWLNGIIDICFLTDIIVVFRTSVIGYHGEEVLDKRIIAHKYFRGSFFLDFFSSVPFDTMAKPFLPSDAAENLAFFGILKMLRVFRLNKIIMYLNVRKNIKDSIRFMKVIFLLLMYLHFTGCIWYFIINRDKQWIPPSEFVSGWGYQGKFFDESEGFKYAMSFYHACLFIFGSDSGARTDF